MSKAQKSLRGVTQAGNKIRCLTAPGHGTSRNVGEPWWNTLEQIKVEMDKRAPRFFVDRGKQVDGDDLAAIKDVTDEDARQLNIRGFFRYSQIVKPEGALAAISFSSYFQHSQVDESRRRMAVRHFREDVSELGIAGALEVDEPDTEFTLEDALRAIVDNPDNEEADSFLRKHLPDADHNSLVGLLKKAHSELVGSPGNRKASTLVDGILDALAD